MNLVSGNDFFKESYMKLKNSWILLLACLCLYSACREEQKTTQIIVKKQQVAAPKATQKMGDYQQSRPVEWLGAEYTVTVDLKADTSLPLVKEGNQKYYDNRIRLTITRSDKSQFFSREFTKPTSPPTSTMPMHAMGRCWASYSTGPTATIWSLRPASVLQTSPVTSICLWSCVSRAWGRCQ